MRSGRRREASGSGVSRGAWYFLLESLPLPVPTLTSNLAPALHTPGGSRNSRSERGQEREAYKWAVGGASCLSLVWLEGEEAVGLGMSDAISSQGTIKVAVLPGGPGCLQRSPVSAAFCFPPGLPVLGTHSWGACCLGSHIRASLWLTSP